MRKMMVSAPRRTWLILAGGLLCAGACAPNPSAPALARPETRPGPCAGRDEAVEYLLAPTHRYWLELRHRRTRLEESGRNHFDWRSQAETAAATIRYRLAPLARWLRVDVVSTPGEPGGLLAAPSVRDSVSPLLLRLTVVGALRSAVLPRLGRREVVELRLARPDPCASSTAPRLGRCVIRPFPPPSRALVAGIPLAASGD